MATLADVLFHTVDGIVAVNSEQRITFWNSACAQLLGIPAEEAIGRRCSEVIRGRDPFGKLFCTKRCCVSRLGQGKRAPKTFPLWTRGPDGKIIKLSVSIVLVPSRHSDAWTCVHLLHRDPYMDILDTAGTVADRKKRRTPKAGRRVQSPLSLREQEVIRLLAEGLSTPAISQRLDIRPVTVRNHIQHIEEKLEVHSKVEAVAYAYRHHLLQ